MKLKKASDIFTGLFYFIWRIQDPSATPPGTDFEFANEYLFEMKIIYEFAGYSLLIWMSL